MNHSMNIAKRVFKIKTFSRWAKGVVSDKSLCVAAQEVMAGAFEADLGGGVCKKRIALAGGGKSGGTRTLIAKKRESAIFFIVGRPKSDPGTDFTPTEQAAAKVVAKGLHAADDKKIAELLEAESIKEICCEPEKAPKGPKAAAAR
jgi:hypothetical protein